MKILAVNAGSSSFKFKLVELPEKNELASGYFEKVGIDGSFYTIKYNGEKITKEVSLPNHLEAVKILMEELINMGIINSLQEIEGVGHRIAHGGQEYTESVVLTEEVLEGIHRYTELAPLHNPANIMGVRAFMKELPNAIQVGVFDTAFSCSSLDPANYLYAVPYEWYTEYGVRKYGFHGTSHKFINKTISKYLNRNDLKVISCHIGNGASVTAIDSGKVIDTSLGFSALVGLIMGTRCGDIDVSIVQYIMNKTGKSVDEVMDDLYKRSGLLGVSGISSDSRDVEAAAEEGNERAILANEMYARKIANYIAIYNNELGGADVITLTAGVGENSKSMRKAILDKIASLGVKINEEKNDFRGEFRLISTDDSKIPVYVVPTDEEMEIALETYDIKTKNN